MNATLPTVPATATGIPCAKCSAAARRSGNRVQVRHASVAAVKLCCQGLDGRCVCTDRDGYGHRCAFYAHGTPVGDVPTSAPAPVQPIPDVPAGRYAIRATDGVVRFYVVDRPTEGKWVGRTFVSRQASDELFPIRDRAERTRVLSAILVDPRGASVLYGRELGRCGVCGRTLTDEASRAAGIGPVCAGRF
jgi:hypothetical protein